MHPRISKDMISNPRKHGKGHSKKWPKVQEKCCKHFRRFEKMTGGRMQNHRLWQVGLWVNGLDNNKRKTI